MELTPTSSKKDLSINITETDLETNISKEKSLKDELLKTKQKMKFWAIIGAALLLTSIVLSVFVFYLLTQSSDPQKNLQAILSKNKSLADGSGEQTIDIENMTRRVIDGVYVEKGKENILPIAFMIDNHTDARPQAGLEKAQLVIEAEAEGGITRYLAVFASDENLEKIGPIRSARPYFIDWAKELSALYVHVGGSPDALAKMIKENTAHVNEFYNEEYFWRGTDFSAPHNVFTSSEKIGEYLKKKELESGTYFGWIFKDEPEKSQIGTTTNIKINFIIPGYEVEWNYNKATNDYKRMLGGEIHKSNLETELTAKNVIIQYVKGEVLDEAKRQSFEHIGTGKALVCRDGFCLEGTWKKKSAEARTRFYDNDGNEFEFNAGRIWIEVVKPWYEVFVM